MSNEHAVVNNPEETVVDDFNSGFTGEEVRVPAHLIDAPVDETQVEDTPASTDAEPLKTEPASIDTPAATPAPAADLPKARVISEEEYENLMSLRTEMKQLEDKIGGRIGGTERLIQQIQASTTRGEVPKISAEDMKELTADYPDISDAMLPALNRILSKLVGTAGGASIDLAQVEKMVADRMKDATTQSQSEIRKQVEQELQRAEVVRQRTEQKKAVAAKHADADKVFASQEFLDYLDTLPYKDRQTVIGTWDSQILIPVLDQYKASKAPAKTASPASPQKSSVSRTEMLKSAINPRGETPPVRKQATDDDMFEIGFNSKD